MKSSLMVGAAGVAATAGATGAFAADDAKPPPKFSKFLPYAQVGSREGDSQSTGNVTLFMPAMQALNKLLYIKLGGELQTSNGRFEQIGAGYRQKILPTWIVGGFAFYDEERTKHGNTFSQIEIGAELLNPNWEFHATNYSISHNGTGLTDGTPQLKIDGNSISLERQTETPYSGFDGYGSYKIFKTPFTDLRLYAGGFRFTPDSSFDHRPIQGPKGGFEYNIYDLDILGPQSRLQFQGEVRHDEVRHSSGFVSITLRIPLNIGDDSGQGPQALDELDRRMVDDPNPSGSGNILIEQNFGKPEPVIVYGQNGGRTEPTNSIFYVDNSRGAGTYKDPTDFVDATTRGGSNALFILTDFEGDVHEPGNLSSGDIVAGGGTTLTVKGAESGFKITHTFAPGVHNPVVDVPQGQTAITLADHVALYNFAIHGAFGTAIYGHNPGLVTAHGITIQGEGGESGQTGIHIRQDNSTALDFLADSLDISDIGGTGIYIDTSLSSGHVDEHIALNAPTLTNVGQGIHFNTAASGDGSITQHFDIEDAHIDGASGYGINIESFAGGEGSIMQTGAINNADISNTETGIGIYGAADGGTLTQNISIDPTHVSSSGYGVVIGGYAYDGGALTQTITANGLTVDGSAADGIFVYGTAGSSGSVTQNLSLTNVAITNSGGDGLHIAADAISNGMFDQNIQIDGLTIDGVNEDGIHIEARLQDATLDQNITLDNITIDGAADRGVFVYARAGGAGGEYGGGQGGEGGEFGPFALGTGGEYGSFQLTQHVTFNNAQVHSTGDAIDIIDRTGAYATSEQYVAFTGDSSLESDEGGVSAYVSAGKYARVHQAVGLPDVTLTAPSGNGAYIGSEGTYGSHIDQYVLIDNLEADDGAGGYGIDISGDSFIGTLNQTVYVTNAVIDDTGSAAIAVTGNATDSTFHQLVRFDNADVDTGNDPLSVTFNVSGTSDAHQTVRFDNGTLHGTTDQLYFGLISYNGTVEQNIILPNVVLDDVNGGIGLSADALDGTQVTQYLSLQSLTLNSAGAYGIAISGVAHGGTLQQTAKIKNTQLGGGNSGVYIYGIVNTGGTLHQYASFDGLEVTSTYDPFYARLSATDNSHAYQTVTFTGESSLASTDGGIRISETSDQGADAHQSVMLLDVTLDHADATGISVTSLADNGASAAQYISLDGVTITHAGANGIAVTATASSGGTIDQTTKIADAHVLYAYDTGISISASATGTGTTLTQHSSIDPSDATGYYNGLTIAATGDLDAVLHQYASVSDFETGYDKYDNVQITARGQNGANVTQYVTLNNVTAGGNTFGNGVGIGGYADTGSTVTQTVNATNLNASGVYRDGVYISGSAQNGATLFQYATINGSTLSSFENDGLGIELYANNGGFARQTVTATGIDVSGNRNGVIANVYSYNGYAGQQLTLNQITANNENNNGISLNNTTDNGTSLQHAYIDGLEASYEGYAGLYLNSHADGGVAGQYATVTNSTFTYNLVGVAALGSAQDYATTLQKISLDGSAIEHNGTGIYATNEASGGASTEQRLSLGGDTIDNNTGNGIGIYVSADGASFATEHLYLHGYGSVSGNGGTGINISSYASNGGNVEQNLIIYDTTVDNNAVGGIALSAHSYGYREGYAEGYYYFSHVTLNASIAYGSISNNTGTGLTVNINANGYGGKVDADIYVYDETIRGNTQNGFYHDTNAGPYSTITEHLYVVESDLGGNDGNGLYAVSNAAYQGILYEYIYVTNSHLNGNGGSGFVEHDYAQGYYSQNFQTTTISGSTFNNNHGTGATFYSGQNYGPGGFGVTDQIVSITGSDFSYNDGDGLKLDMRSTGNQGRAEQHFTIHDSTFTYNGGDGMHLYRYAGQGVYVQGYPCTTVQGLPGGCAFDRQTVYVYDSAFSHNIGDGIYVGTVANHYGAVYGLSARAASSTLYLYNATAAYNGRDGLEINDRIGDNSYLYENVVAVYSHFDHNGRHGVYANNQTTGYSTTVQYVYLYGSSADNNIGDGIKIQNTADGGSYIYSGVQLVGTETNGNGGNGVSLDLYANGSEIVQQVTADTLTANGNGAYGLVARANASNSGSATQTVAITNSTFDNNIGGGEGSYGAGAAFFTSAGGEGSLATQDVTIDGSEASGNVMGFHFANYAGNGGVATQYATLTGTTATGNSQSGAMFEVSQAGSAGTYGSAIQYVTLDSDDFSHNGGDGLYFDAHASGQGARTAQYITIDGTTATYNGRDGMRLHRYAGQGALTYGYGGEASYALTCDYAQGGYGGCAVVRQTVDVSGSDFSHNTGNGISILTSANIYGSIYTESGMPGETPSFTISNSNVDDNDGSGLYVRNDIANSSFSYQYIAATDTTFDGNITHGIYVTSYAHTNAQIVESVQLYVYAGEASVSGNGGDGIRIDDRTAAGSQLRNDTSLGYLTIDNNTGTGISLSLTGDDSSYARQNFNGIYNDVSGNDRGIYLHASGDGADQRTTFSYNTVEDNTNEGVRGLADTGAYQYVSIQDLNTVTGNAPDYSFDSYTGALQIVN